MGFYGLLGLYLLKIWILIVLRTCSYSSNNALVDIFCSMLTHLVNCTTVIDNFRVKIFLNQRVFSVSEVSTIDDKVYIEARADGWIAKVEELYLLIKNTLKDNKDFHYKTHKNMVMREEIMEKNGVSPKNVPIFDLYKGNKLIATFQPIGLWVLGANGRIDILTENGSYILVDLSEDDTHPKWQVFSPNNRKKGEPFDVHKWIDTQT